MRGPLERNLKMTIETVNHTSQEIEYLRHGDRAMMMRLDRPTGPGPFPAVLDLHGGAWTRRDYTESFPRTEALAEAGIAAAALDFRHAEDGYPSSLIDINYAVRWLKAHAGELQIDPGRIGLVGKSSGGHLAMLSAMRPHDERYASIALTDGDPSIDASVQSVGMLWPVINPLSRYRNALRSRALPNPPDWVSNLPECHDLYWKSEEAMAEGNPMLALEKGEAVLTPPALWVQGEPDPVHVYRDPGSPLDLNEPERFLANYRKAGGEIEIVHIEQATRTSNTSVDPLVEFLHRQMPPAG
jgi:acetyl esterase